MGAGQRRQVWRAEYQKAKDLADQIVGRYTYHGAPLGYTGSLLTGVRGLTKAMTRCDLRTFDLDMHVVHPEEFDRLYDAVKAHDSRVRPGHEGPFQGRSSPFRD